MSPGLSGLLACAVCYGSDSGALAQGAKAGVLVLAVVIVAVLGGIVAVILTFRGRALRLEQATAVRLENGLERGH